MQIGTFRKNVMKTVAVKPAKLGLRAVAKNTLHTNVSRSTVSLKVNVGRLMAVLTHYILGEQQSPEMVQNASSILGDIGYDLTVLCRVLKIKMPTATKKVKLVGTRTAALLKLDAFTTDILAVTGQNVFSSPKMMKIKKVVVLPNKGGAKEERDVDVVDVEAEKAVQEARQTQIADLIEGTVTIYWALVFDLTKNPPVSILAEKFARLQAEYPGVEFVTEQSKAAAKAAKTATKAAAAATTAPKKAKTSKKKPAAAVTEVTPEAATVSA